RGFLQAEDGIRDRTVTGVQTCALPICRVCLPGARRLRSKPCHDLDRGDLDADRERTLSRPGDGRAHARDLQSAVRSFGGRQPDRSEERRVGKECTSQMAHATAIEYADT